MPLYNKPATYGIADDNAVQIDSASVADDEFARFTANGLESRSNAEVLSDIGAQAANTTIPNDGWVALPAVQYEEPAVLRITASGDFTASYAVGDRIKLTQDATEKQFIAYQIDYAGGYTYFVLNGVGTTLSANAITNPYYSHCFSPAGLTEALRENQMLTDIKSIDGTGSGLDADTVDGQHSSAFALSAQESWIAPTLVNSWVNFGSTFETCGYFKDTVGVVHLKGIVKSGTVPATIFTLSVGYRPSASENFVIASNDAYGQLQISSDGAVRISIGSPTWVSLSGVTFRAA